MTFFFLLLCPQLQHFTKKCDVIAATARQTVDIAAPTSPTFKACNAYCLVSGRCFALHAVLACKISLFDQKINAPSGASCAGMKFLLWLYCVALQNTSDSMMVRPQPPALPETQSATHTLPYGTTVQSSACFLSESQGSIQIYINIFV